MRFWFYLRCIDIIIMVDSILIQKIKGCAVLMKLAADYNSDIASFLKVTG